MQKSDRGALVAHDGHPGLANENSSEQLAELVADDWAQSG